jgi:hypothetical protein
MFYLITYATHEERYFKFLKNRVHKVLGFGKKWNGFHDKVKAVIEFCDSVNPDDIVCFVDGFDSMILGTDEEILKAYKSIGQELVFSKEKTIPDTAISNYSMNKIFGKPCIDTKLNSGLYIGPAKIISNFWRDMKPGEDDQRYACAKHPYVDHENRLFYNYSKEDKDVTRDTDGNVYKGQKRVLVIGMPGNENIRSDIIVQPKYFRLLKAYGNKFILEIIILCTLIYLLYRRWKHH